MKRSHKPTLDKTLIFLMLGALVIKLVFAVPVFTDPQRSLACTDAFFYDRIARNIVSGNGFSMEEGAPYDPDSTVAPGYPYFIAAIYGVFANSKIAVVLVQIILNLLLLYIIYRFLKRKFPEKTVILFGIIFALDLNLSIFINQITSETLFSVLFIPGLLLVLTAVEEKKILPAVWAGLLLGAATLVRPVILYFGAPLLIFFFIAQIKVRPYKLWRRIAGWGVVIILQLILITPWVIRNRAVFSRTFYTTVSQINLMRYHAAPLKSILEHKPRLQAQQELTNDALEHETWSNEVDNLRLTGRGARKYILSHPLPYAGIAVLGGLGSLLNPLDLHETGVYLKGQTLPPSGSILSDVQANLTKGRIGKALGIVWNERLLYYGKPVILVFILYGLVHLAKLVFGLRAYIVLGFSDPMMLLFLLTGIYILGLVGFAMVARMRVPAEPLLCSLAAIGLFAKREKKNAG